ncbi:hypothetical protein [Stenotrophomonas terrae]|uniref:hypothetical protein n=1 Tax=Stenotrophomonas terrae TaxID=405446 RepID=UPI00128F33AB|nr:hypothetical protein [Stenotrophomonas terrae]
MQPKTEASIFPGFGSRIGSTAGVNLPPSIWLRNWLKIGPVTMHYDEIWLLACSTGTPLNRPMRAKMLKKLAIALYRQGLSFIIPGCIEIWQGAPVPVNAASAAMFIFVGILVAKKPPTH